MDTMCYSEENINFEKIKNLFKEGHVIGFPTETVYGIGALFSKEDAINKIYLLKKRDKDKPFILHLAKPSDVENFAEDIPEDFYLLAKYFMPGPLTVILKKKKTLNKKFLLDTIAVRVPAHGLTLKILDLLKEPIVGTSANISFKKNSLSAEEVKDIFFGKISSIIDGGRCSLGIPSTIVSLTDAPKILREGFVQKEQIENVLQKKVVQCG